MKIRFVTGNDLISSLIRDREGPQSSWLKFIPSHVEIVVGNPDGSIGYLGAHADGGVQIRSVGYDASTLAGELIIDVSLPAESAAEAFARGKVGQPYDWKAIFGFILFADLHEKKHAICSAFVTRALIIGNLFAGRLARPAHEISPADLLFLLSGRVAIGDVTATGKAA